MNFQFGRVSLVPETRVHLEPVFDVVMIGHVDRSVDLNYLLANQSMHQDMLDAGYQSVIKDKLEPAIGDEPEKRLQSIVNLPIPIRSLDEFNALFSKEGINDAFYKNIRYRSRLGGDYAWLPLAVADFFQTDVMKIARRLWIIIVNEREGVEAFLASDTSQAPSCEENNAILRALALPNVGLLAMPDFERLHISQSLKHIPALRVVNPLPAFLPCSTNKDDGISERNEIEKLKEEQSINFSIHLKRITQLIAAYRSDISLLMCFPYDHSMDGELPRSSSIAEEQIQDWRLDSDRHLLRHVQLVYPYLHDIQGQLSSPCGILAGKILCSSATKGVWRSIAGINLPTIKRPFPNLSIKQVHHLRENLGLAVVCQQNGHVQLDDERLAVAYIDDMKSTNSGELARFMGWLVRSLETLGLNLVFNSEDLALKSNILLNRFFGRLYQMGALRGKNSEDAFTVETRNDGEGRVVVDIEIAPALAIDRLTMDFLIENGGVKELEVRHG